MRSDICGLCTEYDSGNCCDEERKTPIQLVFQCGIADQITEGEESDYRRIDAK